MTVESFTPEVIEMLKWYVYRLIDPRTGETFYVGKGTGNRVFAHARANICGHSENARHANDCLALLAGHPGYVAMPPRQLWRLVTHASGKAYNQQMHVILGLAKAGLLQLGEHRHA